MGTVVDNFFILLRLGLEMEAPTAEIVDRLGVMSLQQWQEIRRMADKQSVSAITFDGLNLLVSKFGKERVATQVDATEWRRLVVKWMGVANKVEQRNKQQLEVMEDLASRWTAKGCQVMVFKGQASATMYPHPEHRNPGDIDCYLFDKYAQGNQIARDAKARVDESWYKHSVISYHNETFENHQYFVHTRDGKKGKLLEKALETELLGQSTFCHFTTSVLLPPQLWLAMFLTYHACAHFVSEGLRLKQLLDWAMFLNKNQNSIDWEQFYAFCEQHHLRRFADAATNLCVHYLGVKITNPHITVSSPYTEKILHSTLFDEDYVFSSGNSGWQNRIHIVRNLFHYRWKYEEIYQESVWRQLWWYVTGFFFKTE